MSHQPVIDGFEFASAGAAQQGAWPLSGFARLRELLASDAGEVGYALQGTRDARGRPSLRVSVSGTLQLRCQRCLEPMPFKVQAEELLVLAATQAEIDAEPAGPGRCRQGDGGARADRGPADPRAAVCAAARILQRPANRGGCDYLAFRRL